MALFIHSENQQLLWNIINRTEHFKRFFHPGSQFDPNVWFRNIIQSFYNEYKSKVMNSAELNQLNRIVITHMVENLKQKLEYREPSTINQNSIGSQYTRNSFIESKQNYVESKEEIYNRQFKERQQQYNSLLEKPKPPTVNFGDTIKDEVISNMDEVMKAHMKQRDEELQKLVPNKGLVIDKKNDIDIQNTILTIDSNDEKTKKSVSWKDTTETSSPSNSEIIELKSQVLELRTKFEKFEQDIQKIFQLLQPPNVIRQEDEEVTKENIFTKIAEI
jgi:hypothetical protein